MSRIANEQALAVCNCATLEMYVAHCAFAKGGRNSGCALAFVETIENTESAQQVPTMVTLKPSPVIAATMLRQ